MVLAIHNWLQVRPRITVIIGCLALLVDAIYVNCVPCSNVVRNNSAVHIKGEIISSRSLGPRLVLLKVEDANAGHLVIRVAASQVPAHVLSPPMGQTAYIETSGRLLGSSTARAPWERQSSMLLMDKSSPPSFTSKQAPPPVAWLLEFSSSVRERMVSLHVAVLGQPNAALLSSMVIGDKAVALSSDMRSKFRMLGLSHLVAASGFNLTIVVAVSWVLIRLLTRNEIVGSLICASSIAFFCLLAGFSASVERAALMCTTLLVASCLRRSIYLPASVSLALMITLAINPRSINDVGLQLSYAATFAIALAVDRCNRICVETARLPTWLADAVVVVVVANASVLPIQMFYFWQVGALSLPANVLVTPLVAPITILGFISSVLAAFAWGPLSALAGWVDWIVGWAVAAMLWVVNTLSEFRWSLLNVGAPDQASILVYYGAMAFFVAALPRDSPGSLEWKRLGLALVVLVLATGWLFYRPPLECPTCIAFRDAVVIISPARAAVVYGNPGSYGVQRCLAYFAVRSYCHVAVPVHPDVLRYGQRSRIWEVKPSASI